MEQPDIVSVFHKGFGSSPLCYTSDPAPDFACGKEAKDRQVLGPCAHMGIPEAVPGFLNLPSSC